MKTPLHKFLLLVCALSVGGGALHAQTAELTAVSSDKGLSVKVTVRFPSDVGSVGCAVTLPEGWFYLTGQNEPAIRPQAGQTLELEWAEVDARESMQFTFELRAREGGGGRGTLGLTAYWMRDGQMQRLEAKPLQL